VFVYARGEVLIIFTSQVTSFNVVPFLTTPRKLFGEIFRVLKPGAVAVIGFTANTAVSDALKRGQIKVWKDMNSEQHLWIVGSYFQFSAGSGWSDLKGYDLSDTIEIGKSQKKKQPLGDLFGAKNVPKGTPVYLTTAQKRTREGISDPAEHILSTLWAASEMDEPEKQLVALRLTADYKRASSDEKKQVALQVIVQKCHECCKR
jgi:hypothetical protein